MSEPTQKQQSISQRQEDLRGFAHGKVILLGEHAVVYGHPALCGALRDGVEVVVMQPSTAMSDGSLVVPAWPLRTPGCAALLEPGERSERLCAAGSLGAAYGALLRSLDTTLRARGAARNILATVLRCELVARFAIPTGAGLGSSAALSVAVARAIDGLLRRAGDAGLTAADIAAAALAAETVFHGKPSGLDHTVAQHGGFGLFRRGEGFAPVAARAVPLCVGMSGRARDTRGRVARVAELWREQPEATQARFRTIAALATAGAAAVQQGDLPALGEAMNHNQEVLRSLEVSCVEIDELCRSARAAGALGVKLTGGGGGGCVIALAPGCEARVQEAWQHAGFASFTTCVGDAEAR